MSRGALGFAGAIVFFAAMSCSSLEGLSGQGNTTENDGGVATGDAGGVLGDGGGTGDGGAPATGTFCERERARMPAPLLCSDFETPFVLDGVWEQTAISPGAKLVREEENVSPSDRGRLRSITGALVANAESDALVFKYLSKKITRATLGFDLRMGAGCSATGAGVIALANMGQGDAAKKWVASINFRPGGLVFNTITCSGACNGTEHTLASPPAPGTWARVELAVDAAQAKATVTIDKKPSYDGPASIVTNTTDEVLLNVGNNATGPTTACEMEFDDVLFVAE